MVIRTKFNLATLALQAAFMAFTASAQADSIALINLYPNNDCTTTGTDLIPVTNNMTTPLIEGGCQFNDVCMSYMDYPFKSAEVSDEEGSTSCKFWRDDDCGDVETDNKWHELPPDHTLAVVKQKGGCESMPNGPMMSYKCVRDKCNK